jgi:hypothetical protein
MTYTKKILLAFMAMAIASGSSFTAFADNDEENQKEDPVQKTVVRKVQRTYDYSQLIAPMEAREDAIASSWVAEFEANGTALLQRREELTAAYALTETKAVKAAVKAAHKKFREAKNDSRKQGIAERKLAWETFNKAVKSLRVPAIVNAE